MLWNYAQIQLKQVLFIVAQSTWSENVYDSVYNSLKYSSACEQWYLKNIM
jgi:hypothetical protein